MLIFLGHFIEPVINPLIKRYNFWSIPFKEIAASLKNKINASDLVIVTASLDIGNLLYHIPSKKMTLMYNSFNGLEELNNPESRSFTFVWVTHRANIPKMLSWYGKYFPGIDSADIDLTHYEFKTAGTKKFVVEVVHLSRK
jgi:hypothetical protein